jgi:peroxiredoxin
MEPIDGGEDTPTSRKPEEKRKLPRRYIYIILFAVVIVLLAYIFLSPLFVNMVGETAPDFSVTDIDGNEFNLSENRDKVVVLDLMALFCPVCTDEMKHLRTIFSRYSTDELVLVTISIDGKDSIDELNTFRTQYGDNWTFARDTDGVKNKYKVRVIPTIVIIDKEGIIRFWEKGEISASRLSSEIDKWL